MTPKQGESKNTGGQRIKLIHLQEEEKRKEGKKEKEGYIF